jgi:hypothetical protein
MAPNHLVFLKTTWTIMSACLVLGRVQAQCK